jgi:hypothetical protein
LGTSDSLSLTVAQQSALQQFGKMQEKLSEVQFELMQAEGQLKIAQEFDARQKEADASQRKETSESLPNRDMSTLAEVGERTADVIRLEEDIEILESHHRLKVDAPSGTALMLGEAAAEGRGKPLKEILAKPYLGPDAPRKEGEIGMAVRRAGGLYGEHEVMFASPRQVLRLSHMALDRAVFAEGAVQAGAWAAAQPPGLYGMDDVLGLGHTG